MSSKTSRVYLTKKELQLEESIELVALIKKISSDAILTELEIYELKNWLNEHSNVDIPAFSYLASMIEEILIDKVITDDELRNLYSSLEKVLPVSIRQELIEARKKKQNDDYAKIQEEYDREEIEKIRSTIKAGKANINVHFDEWPLSCFGTNYEGRSDIVSRHAKPGQALLLELEPDNKFSNHAIKVLIQNGMHIGYIQDYKAKKITKFLKEGCKYYAEIERIYYGDGHASPNFTLYLFHPDTTNKLAKSINEKHAIYEKYTKSNGCMGIFLVLITTCAIGVSELYGLF